MSPMKYTLERRMRWRTLLFLFPSLLGALVFFVLPCGMVAYYALVDRPVGGEFVGLSNFLALMGNRAFLTGLKNTVLLCAGAVGLGLPLSLGLALLLEGNLPGRGLLRTVFLSPMLAPAVSVVLVWEVLFHQNGAVNAALNALGMGGIDWFHTGWGRWMVLLLYLWKNLGLHTLLFTAALSAVPGELLDMAALDGAGRARRFFAVKLPFLTPTALFVVMLTLVSSMKLFREVWLLTGSYPYDYLYLLQHFMNNTFLSMDYPKLSAAALALAGLMCAVIGLLFWLEERAGRDLEHG